MGTCCSAREKTLDVEKKGNVQNLGGGITDKEMPNVIAYAKSYFTTSTYHLPR